MGIINDVMKRVDGEWTSFGLYFQALVYFEKITTGNATNDSWNISESKKVQKTLALIISDYIDARSKVEAEFTSTIPKYIRTLFEHYCSKNIKPDFNGIDQIREKMAVKLQSHFFVDTISQERVVDSILDGLYVERSEEQSYVISREKVSLLFPHATMYINEQE